MGASGFLQVSGVLQWQTVDFHFGMLLELRFELDWVQRKNYFKLAQKKYSLLISPIQNGCIK
jgi:hypothetical protein